MKIWLKSVMFFCLYYSGLEWLLARMISVRAAAMLMYHGVCDDVSMPEHINFHVKPAVFKRQMKVLKSRYKVLPLSELVGRLAKGEPIEKSIVITFDDGYRNNATHAAPVLRELGLPAVIFASTKYIGTDDWMPLNEIYWAWSQGKLSTEEMGRLRKDVRSRPATDVAEIMKNVPPRAGVPASAKDSFQMLSWDEVRKLAAEGIEFGSHTHSHCNMAIEDGAHQRQELVESKQLLVKSLNSPVISFAYPYGRKAQMNEAARSAIMETGYQCAISGEYGVVAEDSDRFCLPRLGYDAKIWNFAGEILYQFVKQAIRPSKSTARSQEKTSVSAEPRTVKNGVN